MLIACHSCHRQYDVSAFATGSKIRCHCGETCVVAERTPKPIEMLYCARCGGKLSAGDSHCTYCSSEVANSEGATAGVTCPRCFHRVVSGARHCGSCGVEIQPETVIKAVTDQACPRCSSDLVLHERQDHAFHECTKCGGTWLGTEAFEGFARAHKERAKPRSAVDPTPALPIRVLSRLARRRLKSLRCPVCRRPMRRQNFAGSSGVLIDRCTQDGFWFDAKELEEIARFIQGGGLERSSLEATVRRQRRRNWRIRRWKRRVDRERRGSS